MKKESFRVISFALALVTVFCLFGIFGSLGAVAVEEEVFSSEDVKEYPEISSKDGANILQPTFSGKTIQTCKYVYNLDDSADYIYIAFYEGGYALFSRDTMEIMEYSLQGELPYSDSSVKNYYAGPTNYYLKNSSQFVDMRTNKQLDIAPEDVVTFSQQVRTHIKSRTSYRADISLEENDIMDEIGNFLNFGADKKEVSDKSGNPPDYNGDVLIQATLGTGTFIPNYRYFVVNPTHGENMQGEIYGDGNTGTCGPVAAQLLLGYHNYYSDRRIIENRFLDGWDDVTNSVATPQFNPNYCTDPMEMTTFILGTRSHTEGDNSFYLEMISRIMDPGEEGVKNRELKNGIQDYLSDRLASNGYLIDDEERSGLFGSLAINSSIIKGEIDAGRPIIISTDKRLGAINHFVVGYGYQDFTYVDGSGTYEGYVVHMGWSENETACVWINSAWCDGYVSLKINHVHSYYTVGPISGTDRTEQKCTTCGHRTDAAINVGGSTGYSEYLASIPQNEYVYKDYYVTFATAGRKLFMTFGNIDVQLYLFDTENNQLAYDDDDGNDLNAMLYYSVLANKPYILRVKLYSETDSGDVKFSIIPECNYYSFYEQIDRMTGTGEAWSFELYTGETFILTFTPPETGNYRIRTAPVDNIDTVLYVVDTASPNACLYVNPSGSMQAEITTNLTAGKSYFIVVSTANIATEEGFLYFYISKAL